MDSYVQRQISQSDCEISRNCGKKKLNKASIEVREVTFLKMPVITNNCLLLLMILLTCFKLQVPEYTFLDENTMVVG